jgi:calcium-dependent protein kinase
VVEALTNLKSYNVEKKLQQAAITFIVNQLVDKSELIDIANAFKALDTNNDGKLSFQELVEGYKKYFGDQITNS